MTSSECGPVVRSWFLAALLPALACGGGGSGQGPTGDVRFGAVALPTQAQAGYPTTVSAEILADTDKYNVTVRLSLVQTSNPSGVDPLAVGWEPDAVVWGTVLETVEAGQPVTVQETFDLPADLPAGDYAAVLELNAVDFTADDDALQGEEPAQRSNNVVVGAQVLAVTAPALPDVDVTVAKLDRYGFDALAPETFGAEEELFAAGLTVVARTHEVAGPVAFLFELGLPDAGGALTWYPLQVGAGGAGGAYAGPLDEYRLAPKAQLDDEDVEHTVALLANRPRSFQVGLHAPAETRAALAALAALGADAACQLRVRTDPAGAIPEADESNNEERLPLTFFPGGFAPAMPGAPTPGDDIAPGKRAATVIRSWSRGQDYGGDVFASRWGVDAAFSTKAASAQAARDLRFTSNALASLTLLEKEYTALDARSVGNLDLDTDGANLFAATAAAFGTQVLSERTSFTMSHGRVVLYDRQKELYSASKTRTKEFLLGGFIPMTVTGKARLEFGILGLVTAGPDRRLTLGIGPWVNATGTADASVHLAVADGGVTGDLRFVYYDQLYDNALVLTDELTRQYQFGETFDLKTLDGDVYLHARTAVGCGRWKLHSCHYKKTLLDWNGYSKTFTVPIVTADLPQ